MKIIRRHKNILQTGPNPKIRHPTGILNHVRRDQMVERLCMTPSIRTSVNSRSFSSCYKPSSSLFRGQLHLQTPTRAPKCSMGPNFNTFSKTSHNTSRPHVFSDPNSVSKLLLTTRREQTNRCDISQHYQRPTRFNIMPLLSMLNREYRPMCTNEKTEKQKKKAEFSEPPKDSDQQQHAETIIKQDTPGPKNKDSAEPAHEQSQDPLSENITAASPQNSNELEQELQNNDESRSQANAQEEEEEKEEEEEEYINNYMTYIPDLDLPKKFYQPSPKMKRMMDSLFPKKFHLSAPRGKADLRDSTRIFNIFDLEKKKLGFVREVRVVTDPSVFAYAVYHVEQLAPLVTFNRPLFEREFVVSSFDEGQILGKVLSRLHSQGTLYDIHVSEKETKTLPHIFYSDIDKEQSHEFLEFVAVTRDRLANVQLDQSQKKIWNFFSDEMYFFDFAGQRKLSSQEKCLMLAAWLIIQSDVVHQERFPGPKFSWAFKKTKKTQELEDLIQKMEKEKEREKEKEDDAKEKKKEEKTKKEEKNEKEESQREKDENKETKKKEDEK